MLKSEQQPCERRVLGMWRRMKKLSTIPFKATEVSLSESVLLKTFHGAEEDDDNPVNLKNGSIFGSSSILVLILSFMQPDSLCD